MRLKVFLIFSMLLLIITVGAVSAENNITDEVTQAENSDVLEKTVTGNTFNDIQKTVSSCNDGDTVELNGIYSSSNSPVTISKSITIEGNGATLDAGKKSSIMKVTSKKLTLKNIKFTNSKGVALYSKNSNLVIINCTFTNGGGKLTYDKTEYLYSADCDCAGINAKGGSVTLINSTFSANSIANIGYSVAMENGMFTAQNTIFKNHKLNYDKMSYTGNIVWLDNSKSTFTNCTFKDNTVPAIYVTALATITDSNFHNNYGGVTYFSNPDEDASKHTLNIYNSRFSATKNIAFEMIWNNVLNIEGCNFTENTASIINSESIVNIKNSRFTKNSAKNGAVFETLGKATITNSTFTSNTAQKGSIIYNYDYLGFGEKIEDELTIKDSIIKDSLSTVEGGAIYATCTNIKLINTSIETQKNSKGSQIYLKASNFKSTNSTHQPVKNDKFTFKALYANIKTTTYDSQKRFEVTIGEKIDDGYQAVSYVKAKFKVYTGKKYKIYYYDASKESRPDAFFKITSQLSVGKHKIIIMPNSKYSTFPQKTFTLTVKKAKTIIKAKKMAAKYKKSNYYKITVKNKASGKVVSKLKIKVKIYTGKKYKKITLKTDKKGVAKFNTKKLKRGKHKIEITSSSKNYEVMKKSTIKIK